MDFLFKRSGTASKRPDPASMSYGQIALNYNVTDGGIFYKDSGNGLIKVGPASVGSTAPNATPAGYAGNSIGEFWYDTGTNQLKTWNGTCWVTSAGVTSITAGSGLTGGTITSTGTIALATSGVTAGTYSNSCVTVDCFGRVTSISSGCSPVLLCTVTAKGDLIAGTGNATVTALPAGGDGQFLVACSSCPSGLTYVTTSCGGTVPDASTTVKGVIQIATDAQTLDGVNCLNAVVPSSLQAKMSDSVSCTSSCVIASATAVKCAYDLASCACTIANAALPKSAYSAKGDVIIGTGAGTYSALGVGANGCVLTADSTCASGVKWAPVCAGTVTCVTGTSPISVDNTTPSTPVVSIATASTSALGATQLVNSISSTSTTCAATPASVKCAYDLANSALPLSGGTMTGTISFAAGQTFPVTGIQDATAGQKGVVQVGSNISVASGTISVSSASTSGSGVVQLYDALDSSSTSLALTAYQGCVLQSQIDALSVANNLTLAGTIDGSTGLLLTVTTAGDLEGFTVGDVLPSPTSSNEDYFVIVTVAGTMTPTGGTSQETHQGDWWVSGGSVSGWVFLDVGFNATYASTTTAGIVCLSTSSQAIDGTDSNVALVPSALQAKVSNSISSTCTNYIASSAAVKCAYDIGAAAIPCYALQSKGQLLVGCLLGSYGLLNPGTNGQILRANSLCTLGLEWVNQSSVPNASPTTAGVVFGLTCDCQGYNTALGYCALNCFTSVNGPLANVAIGCQALNSITSAKRNIAIGNGSLISVTSGCNNIAIGDSAGFTLSTACGNVIIGSYTGCSTCNNNIFLADGDGNVRIRVNECGALASGGICIDDFGCSGYVLTSQGPNSRWTWCPAAATGVTCVTAGSGLCGGPITSTGSLCLDVTCVVAPTAYTAKGDILAASAASAPTALSIGTDGQVLAANSACATGLAWTTITQCTGTVTSVAAGAGLTGGTITGSGTLCLDTTCVLQPTLLTAKGSLISASAASSPTALGVGSDGQVLTANSACGSGLEWATITQCTGTVTSITAGTGLTGGIITGSGTIALDTACVIQPNAYTAKGTLLTASAASTTTALPVGTNGQVLTACSDCTGGLAWVTPVDSTPVGTVAFFAASTPPTGWIFADGSCVSRTTYAALFAVIGTTYGAGNGSTTFQLPDLRGRFVRGWNNCATGCDPSRTFGSCQSSCVGPHNHTMCAPVGDANSSNSQGWTAIGCCFVSLRTSDRPPAITSAACNQAMTCSGCLIGTETRPDNIALLPCIKTGISSALSTDATPTVAGLVLGCTNNLCHNTAFGCNAGLAIAAATTCLTAVGKNALCAATGNGNVALGAFAGAAQVAGTNNTYIGNLAGCTQTSGSNNTLLGNGATPSTVSVSNEITLGNSSIATIRAQVTTITSLSDGRDKKHIRDIPIGLDFIDQIRPIEFEWNMRDGGKVGELDIGFIAQDLQEVQEEIGYTLPGLVYDANPDRLEAGYGKLIPVLVKAIQELSSKNKELERRLLELENR